MGVGEAGADAVPHGVDRHAERQREPGGEEHLAVADVRRDRVLERFVGEAAEVVGGHEAGADDAVDGEELVEVGELEQLDRIVGRERDAVGTREVGDGRRAGRALEVAVQLDLGQVAGEGEDVHGSSCMSERTRR